MIGSNPVALSTPLLLTDGRILAQYVGTQVPGGNQWQDWYALTPDQNGCYSLNANDHCSPTWAPVASLNNLWQNPQYAPIAFASAVLADGKVIVQGGEGNGSTGSGCSSGGIGHCWTTMGALYDPAANTWTKVTPPPGWTKIGDAPATVLANGTWLLGNACSNQSALYTESTGWINTGLQEEYGAEASYTLLPNGKVLTIDTCLVPGSGCNPQSLIFNSELYSPSGGASGAWSSAGSVGTQVYGSGLNSCGGPTFGEQGPAVLRPDGTYFATGAYVSGSPGAVHTAVYNTTLQSWQSNPDLPIVNGNPVDPADQGMAVLPDGSVLFKATEHTSGGAHFIKWDGASYCEVNHPAGAQIGQLEMVTLPTGQVMLMGVSWGPNITYLIYSPGVSTYAGIAPTLNGFNNTTFHRGLTYTATGTKFNGSTQGTGFGDDFQNATNYPLVRITNDSTGHIYYVKTHDHSTMGVATASQPTSTEFDIPATAELGFSHLVVVANGIPSNAVIVNVQP